MVYIKKSLIEWVNFWRLCLFLFFWTDDDVKVSKCIVRMYQSATESIISGQTKQWLWGRVKSKRYAIPVVMHLANSFVTHKTQSWTWVSVCHFSPHRLRVFMLRLGQQHFIKSTLKLLKCRSSVNSRHTIYLLQSLQKQSWTQAGKRNII